nr:MAG TPA: hypothetical protein [Caudoviricetes sp.]
MLSAGVSVVTPGSFCVPTAESPQAERTLL